jgi:hypothetical protein
MRPSLELSTLRPRRLKTNVPRSRIAMKASHSAADSMRASSSAFVSSANGSPGLSEKPEATELVSDGEALALIKVARLSSLRTFRKRVIFLFGPGRVPVGGVSTGNSMPVSPNCCGSATILPEGDAGRFRSTARVSLDWFLEKLHGLDVVSYLVGSVA